MQPQEILWNDMVASLQAGSPPYLGQFLDDSDFDALAEHLRKDLAQHVDRYLRAIGSMCAEHSHGFDADQFSDVLFTALDGFALWELEQAAMNYREEQEIEAAE